MNGRSASSFAWRLPRSLAERLVDRDFYLSRNTDVAGAGVDPVAHFAAYWHAPPLRAPSARAEAWIFALSPFIALALHLLGRDRADVLDCLRHRLNTLAAENAQLRHALCLAIVRFVARAPMPPAVAASLGSRLEVVRIGADRRDWVERQDLAPEGTFAFHDPPLLPDGLAGMRREIPLPALRCATVMEASVFGAAQVASHGAFVVHEPAADPAFHFTTRQCDFVTKLDHSGHAILAKLPLTADDAIDEAVLLGGRGGANYFHFLIEDLTKGYIVDSLPQLTCPPLIVAADLHPQELEALAIALPGRALVRRTAGSRLDVRRLHIPAPMTFVPDCPTTTFWQASAVNRASLGWLRERVLGHRTVAEVPVGPRRVYLARSGGRNIVNAAEVEDAFRRRGFVVVDPATLSFAEQVALFRDATHIAAPVGAALSNLVFASPGARALGIVSPFAIRFGVFASLAAAAGCDYHALPGVRPDYRPGMEAVRRPLSVTHGAFRVDLPILVTAVDAFLKTA